MSIFLPGIRLLISNQLVHFHERTYDMLLYMVLTDDSSFVFLRLFNTNNNSYFEYGMILRNCHRKSNGMLIILLFYDLSYALPFDPAGSDILLEFM